MQAVKNILFMVSGVGGGGEVGSLVQKDAWQYRNDDPQGVVGENAKACQQQHTANKLVSNCLNSESERERETTTHTITTMTITMSYRTKVFHKGQSNACTSLLVLVLPC